MNTTNEYQNEPLYNEFIRLQGEKSKYLANMQTAFTEYMGEDCLATYTPMPINYLSAMVDSGVSSILSALPNFKWYGSNEIGRKNAKMINLVWQDWLLKDNSQQTLAEVFQSALLKGAGYLYESWYSDHTEKNITEYKNGKPYIKKKKTGTYYGSKSTYIPPENVFYDGASVDRSDTIFILQALRENEFLIRFSNKELYDYDLKDVKSGIGKQHGSTSVSETQTDVIELVECFKISTNEYLIFANGIWLNMYEGGTAPNPFPHRKAPISEFMPYPINERPYGRLLAKITQASRGLVQKYDEIILKAQQNMLGILSIDAFGDTIDRKRDPETMMIELRGMSREDIDVITPQINVQYALAKRREHQMDMVIESGIDFMNITSVNQYETGTAVNSRVQEFQKRINSAIKKNAYSFFHRWAVQRISNLQAMFDYKEYIHEISVDGKALNRDEDMITADNTEGASSIELMSTDLEGNFDCFLDVEMLIGTNKAAQLQEMQSLITVVGNMINPDGTPYLSNEQKMDLIFKTLDYTSSQDLLGTQGADVKINENIFNENNLPNQVATSIIPTQGTINNI